VPGYGLYFFGVRLAPFSSFLLPGSYSRNITHTFKKYEGTLRLFAPSNPAHHADPALALDEVTDALSRTNPRPWAPLLLAGGAAGIIGWLGTFPFDVIKTRMQAHDIGTGTGSTGSSAGEGTWWRAARELYAEASGGSGGRMRVFWRGFVPTIVRAVPVNMAVFGTFEGVVWAFS
jgi:solute carrier family 25 carnitine/acylcarnitine transporter 20/29